MGRIKNPSRDEDMEEEVKCPVCGSEWTHMSKVVVNAMGQITTISKDGTTVSQGEPSGRGTRVTVCFWCEDGHEWLDELQFHEGMTMRSIDVMEQCVDQSDLPRD